MTVTLEWVLTTLVVIALGIMGILYGKIRENAKLLNKHEVMFASLSRLPERLEHHEEKEENFFAELGKKIDLLKDKVHAVELMVTRVEKNTNGTITRS